MRRLLVSTLLLSSALALQGCGSACKDLGHRLCQCTTAGTSRDTCQKQMDNLVSDRNPSESLCQERLDTCGAPSGTVFCEWIQTSCGKASCGLSDDPIHTAELTGACDAAAATP